MKTWLIERLERMLKRQQRGIKNSLNPEMLEQEWVYTANVIKAVKDSNIPD